MCKKILYITSSLPSVTQTFVYREIGVLLKAGYEIGTVSRKRPEKRSVSQEALHLYESTMFLDQASRLIKCFCQFRIFFFMPVDWIKTLVLALKEKEMKGLRDRLRLLSHFLDAGYVYLKLKDKGFQHIHAHLLAGPTSVALFLSKYLKIPFTFTMHASLIFVDPIMLRTKLKCSLLPGFLTAFDYNFVKILLLLFEKFLKIIKSGI